MDDYKIRLGHTDSVDAVDRENFLDVELKNTSKKLKFNDIKKTIDQYEQFQLERDNCNRYRLILTINPFCTNVLFNPFTEMVKYSGREGNWTCQHVYKNASEPDEPDRLHMIDNTIYSNDKNGYIYYPGYDMFDNHLMRNRSFKVVLQSDSTSSEVFNTLGDVVRIRKEGTTPQTKVKKIYKRVDGLESQPVPIDMHLYGDQDILSFEDSVNSNLYEENGWFGFINHSNLITNMGKGFEKVINNKEACEFVDMYPSRNLFSFNPTYNKYMDRLEYNWDIVLTYPYENFYNNDIVNGTGQSGLKILSVEYADGLASEKVVLIRSYVKHNLQRHSTVFLYMATKSPGGDTSEYNRIDKPITVMGIGDLKGNNQEYFFYINNSDIFDADINMQNGGGIAIVTALINMLLNGTGESDFNILDVTTIISLILEVDSITLTDLREFMYNNKIDIGFTPERASQAADNFLNLVYSTLVFRFARVINGEPSKYYIRKFRKIPNLKKRKRDVNENDLENKETFQEYLNGDGNVVYKFDNEFYKLGFAETIYGDECTQITYTDTIDIEHLTDNLGRPLSEMYATIIKRNVGAELWYNNEELENDDLKQIEQSCCFGEVTSGIEISDITNDTDEMLSERAFEGDVKLLHKMADEDYSIESNVTSDFEEFFGDVVEFSPTEYKEYVLSDVCYRFNTYQRENPITVDGVEMPFTYHEIEQDDYDRDEPTDGANAVSFKIEENELNEGNITQKRDEGYYHKAHYQIKLHDFGEINQASHYDLTIREITPVQSNKIYIKVRTTLPHNLNVNDIVLLCDDINNVMFKFSCSYIYDRTTFYIIPLKPINNTAEDEWVYFKELTGGVYEEGLTWLSVTQYLKDATPKLCLRKANVEIPSYATKLGKNTYLWRNILPIGDDNSTETPEYTYTNNAFYISKTIDFFLKRQDPDGTRKLYAGDTFPNDVAGKIKKVSKYEYKEEVVPVC